MKLFPSGAAENKEEQMSNTYQPRLKSEPYLVDDAT